MSPGSALSVIIYGYNEEDAVQTSLVQALEHLEGLWGNSISDYEIVFVDDGSTDRTVEIVREMASAESRISVEIHGSNRGIGAAIKTGVSRARMDLVTCLPADGQVTVAEVERLLPLVLQGADIAVGYFEERGRVDGAFRMFLSKGLRLYMRLLLSIDRRMDGLFVMPRDTFMRLAPRSDTFMLNLEVPVRALKAGMNARFEPIGVHPRIAGESKVLSFRKTASVALEVLGLAVDLRLHPPQRP